MCLKDISIRSRTYYIFSGIMSITDFDPGNIEIDEKSYKIFLFTISDMWKSKKT